jgi:hypothetical protein
MSTIYTNTTPNTSEDDPIMHETIEEPRRRRAALYIVAVILVLPFVYLASLALFLSAYVHGWSIPSRAFLRAYAAPSNAMAATPGVGPVFSNYFRACSKVTRADYDPNQTAEPTAPR